GINPRASYSPISPKKVWPSTVLHPNRAGSRFVDLAGTCRQQLREWISASVFYTAEPAVANQASTQSFCLADETDHEDLPGLGLSDHEGSSRHRMSAYLMLFALGALSLFSGVVFARRYLGGPGDQQIKGIMDRTKLPEIPPAPSIPPANLSPATMRFLPPTLPLSVPGLVLQVAAMQHEGNADALAKHCRTEIFLRSCSSGVPTPSTGWPSEFMAIPVPLSGLRTNSKRRASKPSSSIGPPYKTVVRPYGAAIPYDAVSLIYG